MPTGEFLDLDGPVHFKDHGGDGPPMVLVHGIGGSYLNWTTVAPKLARSHRVYAIDLAGFGLTPPAGRRSTVDANQELLDAFTQAVSPDEPVVLVGSSMGGLITMLQAARNPDRVAAAVLVNPALPLVDLGGVSPFTIQRLIIPTFPGIGQSAMKRYYEATSAQERVDETLAFITADPAKVPEARRQASIEMQKLRDEMEWAIPSFIEASRSIASALTRVRAFRKMLHKVSCPTLLIHGDKDRVVAPGSARWAAKQRPDWQFRMFHDIGHVPMLECPDEFVAMVDDFLAGVHAAA
ncbi:MAG: alpha/beta hydrolase [Acidimicrobiia bacterium]|nr:alpha/beta hydrolase [Acidimicrobiia bacterium]